MESILTKHLTQDEIDKLYIPTCVTTGEQFSSLDEAIEFSNVSKVEFLDHLRLGKPINGNVFDFKYVPYKGQMYDEPEVWVDLDITLHHYQVSNYGNFRKLKPNGDVDIFKDFVNDTNTQREHYSVSYCPQVGVYNSCLVYKLVAKYFIPNPYHLPVVNHKNGDPCMNYYKNLEWCTVGHNDRHAVNTGLNDIRSWKDSTHRCHKKAVRCIETGQEFESLKSTGQAFGVHPTTILQKIRDPSAIIHKLQGLHFEFVNPDHLFTYNTGIHRFVKSVMCVETNEQFDSLESASQHFGVNYGVISDLAHHVSKNSKLLPGLHFEFVT